MNQNRRPDVSFVWNILDVVLRDVFRHNELGQVILPFVVLRRIDCCLEPVNEKVRQAYAQFKDKGFEVVSISIDKKEDEWRKAVKEEGLEWPNFRSEAVANLFKVKAVPTVYLLDSEGRIVASNDECRGEALAAKLAELMK